MCECSQRGQRVQRVEGARVHGGDLVVVERQETHRAQAHEAAVAHTADPVTPQHTVHTHTDTHINGIVYYYRVKVPYIHIKKHKKTIQI